MGVSAVFCCVSLCCPTGVSLGRHPGKRSVESFAGVDLAGEQLTSIDDGVALVEHFSAIFSALLKMRCASG